MYRGVPLFAGLVVIAILVVGAAASFIPLTQTTIQPSTSTMTSTSATSTTSSASTSTGSTEDLVLRLVLNSSLVPQGRSLSLTVVEWNGLDARNNVNASTGWSVGGLGDGPCGPLNYPFGFEVLSGYYNGSAGLASAQEVQLYAPGPYYCPMVLSGITSYSFYPLSDRADVIGSCNQNPCFTEEMNTTGVVQGDWNGGSLVPLSPGAYTVVAGDEWGTLLFGHFEVTPAASGRTVALPAGTTFQVSSSYDCVAGHYSVNFTTQVKSVLAGGFSAGAPGVTLFVATTQQASVIFQGHPSSWEYSTGLVNSSAFAIDIPPGAYVVWIEGADLNCGAKIVTPLEQLTMVNITMAFTIDSVGSS